MQAKYNADAVGRHSAVISSPAAGEPRKRSEQMARRCRRGSTSSGWLNVTIDSSSRDMKDGPFARVEISYRRMFERPGVATADTRCVGDRALLSLRPRNDAECRL